MDPSLDLARPADHGVADPRGLGRHEAIVLDSCRGLRGELDPAARVRRKLRPDLRRRPSGAEQRREPASIKSPRGCTVKSLVEKEPLDIGWCTDDRQSVSVGDQFDLVAHSNSYAATVPRARPSMRLIEPYSRWLTHGERCVPTARLLRHRSVSHGGVRRDSAPAALRQWRMSLVWLSVFKSRCGRLLGRMRLWGGAARATTVATRHAELLH